VAAGQTVGGLGAILIATTKATFTPMRVIVSGTAGSATANLFQTQMVDLVSSIGTDPADTVTWCLQDVAFSCGGPPGPGSYTSSLNTATYTAVDPLPIGADVAYVCAQEDSVPMNFACADLHLTQLMLSLTPSSATVPANDKSLSFLGQLNAAPASAPITSWVWSTGGASSPGNPQQLGETDSTQDSYLYEAPMSAGEQTLTLSVVVNLAGHFPVYGGTSAYSLNKVAAITVTGLSAQIVLFNPVNPQASGSTLSVTATASSGLPIALSSATPAVCTVAGATATMLAAGTCSLIASQPGNGVYAAAQAQQSFHVYYQGPTLHGFLIQGAGAPGVYGSVAVTFNGHIETFPFGPLSSATSVAAGLAAYFSEHASSPVFAKANGATVTFYAGSPTITSAAISASVSVSFGSQSPPFSVIIQ
jgi:hypothetical protein